MSVGKRIKAARKLAKLTQIQVAQRAGIAVNTLRLYEADKRQPHVEQLQRIAAVFGMTWIDLALEDQEDENIEALQRIGSAFNVDVNWLMNGQTLEQRDQAMRNYVDRRFAEAEADLRKKRQERLNAAFVRLNHEGQGKAVEHVEDLAGNPKYQRTTAPETTPAPPEGKDTTKPTDAPETPPEG